MPVEGGGRAGERRGGRSRGEQGHGPHGGSSLPEFYDSKHIFGAGV
jgi:hypothetical protein